MTATITADGLRQAANRPHGRRKVAAVRQVRAVELFAEGKTFSDIARELGYKNRSGPYKAVRRELDARGANAVDDLKDLWQLEAARLDALQRPVWAKAMAGDLRACRAVMSIIETRLKLYELAADGERSDSASRTVVVDPADLVGK